MPIITFVPNTIDDNIMNGTLGRDWFVFAEQHAGTDRILNFTIGQDRLAFSDITYDDLKISSDSDNNTVIRITNSKGMDQAIVLEGINLDDLSDDHFVFKVTGDMTSNQLWGNDRDNWIVGLRGDDYIYGGGGTDRLRGGAGEDTIFGGSNGDLILGNSGADYILGDDGDDTIYGGSEIDQILGGSGQDTIYGGSEKDYIGGGMNDDTIYGGVGGDRIFGGSGKDVIHGDQDNDIIEAGEGNDTIYGGDGNDMIYGGFDNDTLFGGSGNDRFLFSGANFGSDKISDFAVGEDRIIFIASETSDISWTQNSQGDYVVSVKNSDGDISSVTLKTDGEFEGYLLGKIGHKGGDVMEGTAAADWLVGRSGDDEIFGRMGDDELFGADGNDFLHGGLGSDLLFGGRGKDSFIFDGKEFGHDRIGDFVKGEDKIVFFGLGKEDLMQIEEDSQGNAVIRVRNTGGEQSTITLEGVGMSQMNLDDLEYSVAQGNDRDNWIDARQEGVSESAKEGNDYVIGGEKGDVLEGGDGNDRLYGGDGADFLYGDGRAKGGGVGGASKGDDYLFGGAGMDVLIGGKGNDVLYGGAGMDQYIFANIGGVNQETIRDYENGELIRLGNSPFAKSREQLEVELRMDTNGEEYFHVFRKGTSGEQQYIAVYGVDSAEEIEFVF